MRALRLLSTLLVAIGLLAFAPAASAKAKVDVAAVEFKEGAAEKKAQKRIGTAIRRQAHRAAKHLDFGTKGRVEITFAVRDIKVEEADGVVTITCTLLGKLKGGGSAKSKIRFGGKPEHQTKLERQVVAAATDGVMTRLAQLSRERAAAKAKAEKEEKERGDD
jgi:hypothetical protein